MAIFHPPVRARRVVARHLLGVMAFLAWTASAADAQNRRYLVEVGAAGAAHSFDDATDLGAAAGGLLRAGVWLPWNFSVEGELNFSNPTAETPGEKVGVRTLSAAALFNIPIGAASSVYLKGGAGTTSYGGDCPAVSTPGSAICGTSGTLLLGGGVRLGLTPSLMMRGEGLYNRNRSNAVSLANYSANLGLSLMLGSRPLPDNDRDGIPNRDDRCPGTSQGSRVDRNGCTIDSDGDGTADGVDRCPNTPVGATADALGCPKDSDNDNILDGLDRCPDTRAGVLVDREGCSRDTDEDAIPDGLDRCSATPKGATVDALGCPRDEDADGILDGLDQCPRSPVGDVDPRGCASGQTPRRPLQAPDSTPTPNPVPTPAPEPEPSPTPAPNPTPARTREPAPKPAARPSPAPARRPAGTISITASVLPHVAFFTGTARLRQTSYGTLDSVAAILLADSTLQVEIGAHSDEIKSAAETERLTNLQAEAVRTFLIRKGVPARQMIARGYGARVPLTPDTTPRGLARNRRIEIRRIAPAP